MNIPASLSPDVQVALREIWSAIERFAGSRNIDLHGRRVLNAGDAVGSNEFVTRGELTTVVGKIADAMKKAAASTAAAVTPASSLTGTHAERLAYAVTLLVSGSTWYETDRTVTYTLLSDKTWGYTSGVMVGLDGAWPTDLTTADTGFRYDATDTLKGYRWTGTAWEFSSPLDPPTTAPDTPNTPTPASGTTGASINPTLAWVSERATTYDVYFGASSPPSLVSSAQVAATYTPSTLTNSTVYYWKIDATNTHGTTGGSIWSFTTEAAAVTAPATPNTPSPANHATGITLTPRLSWVSDRATSYTIQFGDGRFNSTAPWELTEGWVADCGGADQGLANYTMPDELGQLTAASRIGPAWFTITHESSGGWLTDVGTQTAPPVAAVNVAEATWTPRRLAPSTTHPWTIIAQNAAGTTSGPAWDFTTAAASVSAPSTPNTPSPTSGATGVATNVTLRWDADGATSFDVYLGLTNPPTILGASGLYAKDISVVMGYGVTAYWKVVAHNAIGSTTGPVWSFTTVSQSAELGTPSTPAPADGAVDQEIAPTLSWATTTGAVTYTMRLGTTAGVTPPVVQSGLTSPSYAAAGLAYSTRYYWCVQAYASDGTRSTGPIWSFVTKAAPTTLPSGPTGHDISISGTTFRSASGQIWKWHFATYFGMLKDYLGSGINPDVWAWASALGVNGFRVLAMKSPNSAMPWAPLYPTDYSDGQLDSFLTEVESHGFYVELVAMADTDDPGWTSGLASTSAKQTHVNRLAAVVDGHHKAFLELCNEPYKNGLPDPSIISCPSGVWAAKGAGEDAAPYVPAWHYVTDHPPRDSEWPRKAKNILEYTKLGWGEYPPMNVPGVCDEPMGIAEADVAGRRTTNAQDCADFYATADLFCGGGTLLVESLSHRGELPGPVSQACCDAVAAVWQDVPTDAQTGRYTRGGLSDCPLAHDDALALRTFAMIQGNKATCVIVRKSAGHVIQAVNGWQVDSIEGYGDNIVKLSRP